MKNGTFKTWTKLNDVYSNEIFKLQNINVGGRKWRYHIPKMVDGSRLEPSLAQFVWRYKLIDTQKCSVKWS